MMQTEFETLYGGSVSPEFYEMIEKVYLYHPFFQGGQAGEDKRLIADFCRDYLPLIQDLYQTALHYEQIDLDINLVRARLTEIRADLNERLEAQASSIHDYMEVK